MKRRPFLQAAGGALAASALGFSGVSAFAKSVPLAGKVNGVPYRVLGRTGEKVSIVGFPGLCLMHEDQPESDKYVKQGFESGINFYDVAPAYGRDGECEIKLGQSLTQLKRDDYFLACKTKMRDAKGAQEELDRSLKRLKTDHFDLYQMHHLRTTDEVKEAFGPGGCMEVFFKAQKEGKVRYLGFSAHTTKSALLAMENHKFDTVMFPINFIESYTFGFGEDVVDLADKQGAAVLAIKPMCGGLWPDGVEKTRNWWYRPLESQEDIDKAMCYSLNKPKVTVGIPPAFAELFVKAIETAKRFHTPTQAELDSLETMAKDSLNVFEERQKRYSMAEPDPNQGLFGCPYSVA